MKNGLRGIQGWIHFAGFVLVVMVLYSAQAIVVPIALAVLLTFLLTPLVAPLQRVIGRVGSTLIVVMLLAGGIGVGGWTIARQLATLAEELPNYRSNIRQKIADVRGAGRGGSVEKVQETLSEIKEEIAKSEPRGSAARPVVVTSQRTEGLANITQWVSPVLAPLATAALVFVLLLFMLLERQDLRNRVISIFGHGHLAITTKAFDEAATRVSRYLLMQTLVNTIYGVLAGVGLFLLGVPYALLWAVLGALLRFIPYAGPWIGAALPILISLAALPGWTKPLYVIGLFGMLELFTNMVLETVLYAGAAGVSQVGLLVAVAFWTWLWGPLGLLMATPLTVCLVVLGKHLPGLEPLTRLMADAPALSPEVSLYQRLLAHDQTEALELVEQHAKEWNSTQVLEGLLLPVLNYAEQDRLQGRLNKDDEQGVADGLRELLADVVPARERPTTGTAVLGYPVNGFTDTLALEMLAAVMPHVAIEIISASTTAEVIGAIRSTGVRVVCFADLPPSAPSKTRYMLRKLREAFPDLTITVGRWASPALADADQQTILAAGANHVSSSLSETARLLQQPDPATLDAGPPLTPSTEMVSSGRST